MKFTLEIEMENDAMRTVEDVGRSLRMTDKKIRTYANPIQNGETGRIMDANGNAVGRWTFSE